MMRLLLCPLLLLLPHLILSEIAFSVEEPSVHPSGRHRHQHRHRHQRDHPVVAADLPKADRFSLDCPGVSDAENKDVHIEVTWTLDDTVLLKIRDGEQIVHFNRSSFRKKSFDGKSVMHVLLSGGRYMFNYDELVGIFSMEINEVQPLDDFGTWQCHITRRKGSESISETTRKTIVAPPGGSERRAAAAKERNRHIPTTPGYRIPDGSGSHHTYLKARIDYGSEAERDEYQTEKRTTQKFSAFTRPDQNSVQISRDSTDRRKQTVVFDRSSVTKDYRQHSIDYEMSVMSDDEENDDFHYEGGLSKRARAAAIGSNGVSLTAGALPVIIAVTVAMLHNARF